MNAAYRISPHAESDLRQVWEYVAADDPAAATRLVNAIFARFEMLARQPLIGTERNDLMRGLRDFTHGRYVIYYRPGSRRDVAIEVVRVLHSARDVLRLFHS